MTVREVVIIRKVVFSKSSIFPGLDVYTLGSSHNLLENIDEDMIEDTRPDLFNKVAKFKIVRNRWNVAYTLIKNPSLISFRKNRRLEEEDEEATFH